MGWLRKANIANRLHRLAAAATAVADGRLWERIEGDGAPEEAFNGMAAALEERFDSLERERLRLRDVTIRFGEALSATHDTEQLLHAIVETAVEATRAAGGHFTGPGGRLIQVGDPDAGPERFELPLLAGRTNFGTIVLYGPGFAIQDIEAASLFVGHAVIALDNARLHRILERQALVDGLTGLANRRSAEAALGVEVARAVRFGDPLAVVMADLDNFKVVNDRYGHPAGDAVLREFAAVLEATVREIDEAARWGGEEFCLVLPGTDAAGAAALAERVRVAGAARTILTPEGAAVQVTASFGVAANPPYATAEELVAAADAALYEAKRAGKDCVSVATSQATA
ncbi:MAG: GGDEF domain-containing protein [Gaiellaceae bacterium]